VVGPDTAKSRRPIVVLVRGTWYVNVYYAGSHSVAKLVLFFRESVLLTCLSANIINR